MEKKTTQASRTGAHASGAHAAGAHRAARPASGGGARSSGGTGARSTSAGAARKGGARPSAGAHAARGTASGKRRPQKRRRGGVRLSARDPRLWLVIGVCVVIVIVAVVLALTLPMGGRKDDAIPASAPAVEETGETADAALDEGAEDGSQELDDGDIQGNPMTGGAAEDASADSEGTTDASDAALFNSESSNASQFTPEMVELMQKYKVLDGIPSTAEPLGIPESARAEDSYFDDALFVGDSVTLKLQRYVSNTRKSENPNLLGQARFLAAQSFSARNALMKVSEKSIHPVIEGVKMPLEDAIAKLAPKKLYLMLGMNDVGVSGIDGALENMSKLLTLIREKCPDMRIIVESATPRLKGTHPTTNQLFVYDVLLYDAILKMNDPMIEFIDIAYAMRDSEGKLVEEYCDDPDNMAIHFTNAGCRQWIDYLYTHPSTAA